MASDDKITSSLWFCFGLFITLKAIPIGLGSLSNPGPGFIFFWSGILLCFLSAIVFLQAYRKKTKEAGKSISWIGIRWKKMILFIIALLVYTYLFEKIGFILSILLLMIYLFKGIEPQKWSTAILSTALTGFIAYSLFVLWLKCQLPRGILPF